jgi:hypothetical protein
MTRMTYSVLKEKMEEDECEWSHRVEFAYVYS